MKKKKQKTKKHIVRQELRKRALLADNHVRQGKSNRYYN